MGFQLEPRPLRRRQPQEDDLRFLKPAVRTDPSDDVPPPSTSAAGGRPRLALPTSGEAMLPSPSQPMGMRAPEDQDVVADTRARIADQVGFDTKHLQDLENTKPKDENGRWMSFILNGLEGMSESARHAIAAGVPNPIAYALGGFAGRGASGAIRPSLDEETRNERDKEQLRRKIGFGLERRAKEAEIQDTATKPAREMAKLKEARNARIQEQQQKERAQLIDIYNRLPDFDPNSKDGRVRQMAERAAELGLPLPPKSRADKKTMRITPDGRVLLADEAGNVSDAIDPQTGQPFSVGKLPVEDLSVPKEFYPDDKALDDRATAEVLSKPEYHKLQMRDVEGYNSPTDAIAAGIPANQVFADPAAGPMFKRDLAATTARLRKEAQEQAQRLAMVERKAREDYRNAKTAEDRLQIRGKFQSALQQFAEMQRTKAGTPQ